MAAAAVTESTIAKGDGNTWGARGDKRDPDLDRLVGLSYLIIDDSRFARATVKNVLHALGIRRVTEMENASQALSDLEKQVVDVVIIDFEMPGMSGAEFTWRLRRSKDERLQRMPVVMISTHADEGHIRTAINAGVNEFLPKPFSQAEILARVKRSVLAPKPFIIAEGYIGPDRRLKSRDGQAAADQGGLRPPIVVDCTGPEPKQFQVSPAGLIPIQPAPQPAAAADANPAPAKPTFSAMAEIDGGLAASVNEKLSSKEN